MHLSRTQLWQDTSPRRHPPAPPSSSHSSIPQSASCSYNPPAQYRPCQSSSAAPSFSRFHGCGFGRGSSVLLVASNFWLTQHTVRCWPSSSSALASVTTPILPLNSAPPL